MIVYACFNQTKEKDTNVLAKVALGVGISVGVMALTVAEALGKLLQCGVDGRDDVYGGGRYEDELPEPSSFAANLRSLAQAMLP